jgi:hypothetical protein
LLDVLSKPKIYLMGISLDAVQPDKAQLAKLLAAAQRNLADAAVAEGVLSAQELLAHVRLWLQTVRPELVSRQMRR